MKKILFAVLVLLLGSVMTSGAVAGEKATKEECIERAQAAAALLKSDGLEAAFAKLNDPNSPFVWKDSYVFCITYPDGVIKAHPVKPKLVGKQIKGIKDINGEMFVLEYMNKAKNPEGGWTDYMWPVPGEKKPSHKSTYTYKVPGMDYIMGAGIHK